MRNEFSPGEPRGAVPGDTILWTEGLSAGYSPEKPVLRDISIRLARGRVLAVIGPNGAGKTTLFRTLSGELPPIKGEVAVAGSRPGGRDPASIRALSSRSRARRIARVLQNENPAWAVSVFDYVEAGLFAVEGWFGHKPGASVAVVRRALGLMAIGDFAERPVTELSGGEFKRVVIARALVQDPDILLLDEPTTGLDMAYQMDTLRLMRDLAQRGKAVAFSVHDLNMAAMAADDILLLAHGEVAASGSPAEVLTVPAIERAYDARVIVERHPVGDIPHIVLNPKWLQPKGGKQ